MDKSPRLWIDRVELTPSEVDEKKKLFDKEKFEKSWDDWLLARRNAGIAYDVASSSSQGEKYQYSHQSDWK